VALKSQDFAGHAGLAGAQGAAFWTKLWRSIPKKSKSIKSID
jgi:hypothetical protein